MAIQLFPTKGNLIKAKHSLLQAQVGFELMDRKRNILMRELVSLNDRARVLGEKLSSVYAEAYGSLQLANTSLGIVTDIVRSLPVDNSVKLSSRGVMGVYLPSVSAERSERVGLPSYSLHKTDSSFDTAYIGFNRAKEITVELAELENSIFRLSEAIKKTRKRANALKNIMIPRLTEQVRFITNALEEKEREEFSRQKVIKHTKLLKTRK